MLPAVPESVPRVRSNPVHVSSPFPYAILLLLQSACPLQIIHMHVTVSGPNQIVPVGMRGPNRDIVQE